MYSQNNGPAAGLFPRGEYSKVAQDIKADLLKICDLKVDDPDTAKFLQNLKRVLPLGEMTNSEAYLLFHALSEQVGKTQRMKLFGGVQRPMQIVVELNQLLPSLARLGDAVKIVRAKLASDDSYQNHEEFAADISVQKQQLSM